MKKNLSLALAALALLPLSASNFTDSPKELSVNADDASYAIDGVLDDACYTQNVKDTAISFGNDGYGRLFTLSACRVEGGAYFVCSIDCNYNNMADTLWYKNANLEFRFGETCYKGFPNVQHYFYFNGKGFSDPKCSYGLSIALVESKQITSGSKAGMYHTVVEFFAPSSVFSLQDESYEELRLFIYGWVWDGNAFEGFMNVTSWAHLPTYYYSYLGITRNGLFWY